MLKDFKINEYITLKLEDNITNLYVKGELFRQCKLLLLNVPTDDDTGRIQSIDEAADKLGWSPFGQTASDIRQKIAPETEFWAHCSNIQAWVENECNTRLLHHTIAFPLLKKLMEVGDSQAQIRLKEEVAKRLEDSTPQVLLFLIQEKYLEVFTTEELESVILNIEFKSNSEKDYLKYTPSLFNNFLYNFDLSTKATVILFEHLFKNFYGNLFDELKQILLEKDQVETQILLFKLMQGILDPNLQRIKLHFNFLSSEEKISLLNEAISYNFFHVIFELLTENPGLLNRLNEDQIPVLVKKAITTGKSPVISLLIDEGFLTHLSKEELLDIIENISAYGFSEKIEDKITEWFSRFKKGYVRFRSCYIHKDDVEILQEIERALDIKLIWTPFSQALSNYTFEIDERRVSKLFIGSRLGKKISTKLVERIKALKNLKILDLLD